MKYIALTQEKQACVDDDIFPALSRSKWFAAQRRGIWYAAKNIPGSGHRGLIYMHREILGLSMNDHTMVDHVNHDGLDNRRCNLRLVTNAENQQNRRSPKGYRWHKEKQKWQPRIRLNGKDIFLGYYDTEEEARRIYSEARRKYHPKAAVALGPD